MITLLRGGWLAAWNGRHHSIIRQGELAFEEDKILYAGPRFEGDADIVVEEPDWFICPGFINLHGHVGLDLMASVIDVERDARFAPSLDFVEDAPLFLEESLTPEEQQLNAEIMLVQMARTGTTTVVDAAGSGTIWWLGNPPHDEEMLVDTVGRTGMRAYLSLSYRSGRSYQRADGRRDWHWDEAMGLAGLDAALRFADDQGGRYDGRVQTLLCPHAVDNCSPALLEATLAAARERKLLIQIHTAQYAHEVTLIRERYGATPVEHLHNLGFLGPDIILGHCVYVTGHPALGEIEGEPDRDLELIAASGSSVAHSPLPFARTGEALHSLPRYLDHGITVGLGCDIWPADIIAEMRLAWMLGKQTFGSAHRPSCRDVFTAATVGSATALGRTDLGRLEAGAQADIVCVDLSAYHFGPIIDPVRSLVAFGTGQDVARTYVAGQVVVDEGRVVNADEARLQNATQAVQRAQFAAATERDPLGRTIESILALDDMVQLDG